MKIAIILISAIGLAILTLRLFYSEKTTSVELTEFAEQSTDATKATSEKSSKLPLKEADSHPFATVVNTNVGHAKNGAQVDSINLDMRESFDEYGVSPEDETYQEHFGVDAMQVEVSISSAPENGYSENNGNAELAIPSERSVNSSNMNE